MQAAAPETVSDVAVVVAKNRLVPDWLEAAGTVHAAQTSELASQVTGNIVEIRVREGDRVHLGQLLAVIDDSQPKAALDQAVAAEAAAQREVSVADSEFALAEVTLKRYQELFDKKSVSPQEFDEIKARYQSAQSRREIARANLRRAEAASSQARTILGFTRICAPFAGVVTQRKADPGTLAAPGTPLLTVEDNRNYRFEVPVDESDIRVVRLGLAVNIEVEALGNALISGKVAQIVPAADPASRTFLVKIVLPPGAGLRSGLFGRARFARGEHSALPVPRAAIVQRGQLEAVYVLDSHQIASLRYITTGEALGEQVEVLSGLQDGETFISSPGGRELSGKKIVTRP